MEERSLFITGAAGEGIQTIGNVVARCFLAHGYPAFAVNEFESRIRGGNSSTRIRVAETPRNAPRETADLLLAMNLQAEKHYRSALSPEALRIVPEATDASEDEGCVLIPFRDLALDHGGAPIYANAVAAGAVCAAEGIPRDILEAVLEQAFSARGAETVDANRSAARAGYGAALAQLDDRARPALPSRASRYTFATAHDVLPVAAAAAGCRFIAAYPMSPSTGIITAFSRHPELGVVAEQAEDEIAAINMALGAAAAGARAMTATSGGGFALMTEGLSLAGMTETPIVIVVAQRPGPATGLPTRTAQEDLLFAIHAGHGEFPRAVLAPSDPQDAIDITLRAFDLADRYQIPAIILTDQYLADSYFSFEGAVLPDTDPRGHLADPREVAVYERYELTDSGVSPRLAIGQSHHLVVIDSDEHSTAGHITEDLATVRPAMVDKRLEKGRRLRREIAAPQGDRTEDAELVLVGWGSTRGAIAEAVETMRAQGRRIGSLHFSTLWPLPEKLPVQARAKYWVVEGNATGQFARLLRAEADVHMEGTIGRYDGLPLDAATIVRALS
jgi:2-oxoglutarate ferredoxin oxidoreductase subunit alpha